MRGVFTNEDELSQIAITGTIDEFYEHLMKQIEAYFGVSV